MKGLRAGRTLAGFLLDTMARIWRDLRFALRVLANNPGFTAVAVITLGLGIAANATVFGWVDAVLLRPIPGVRSAEELAALEVVSPAGGQHTPITHPDFRDFQRQMTLTSGVVASHLGFFTIGPIEHPQRVLGQIVSANFFAVLGVDPYIGRMLRPEEDRDTPGAFPYAVISHHLWRTYFRGDTNVAGSTVRINGHPYTVIGVAPPDFAGTIGGTRLDVWVPLSMILQTGSLNTWAASDRNARFLEVIVRLKQGVTVEQGGEQARAVAARIAAAYPDTHRGVGARLLPMWRASFGLQSTLRNPLRILMAACALVLLIACANVANLLMARSVSRQREFGIRIALGAGRGPLLRQLLTEVLVLAGAGALTGVLLAQWMGESLTYVLPALDPSIRSAIAPVFNPRPNSTVLVFTALIATAAALVSTVMPALHAGRVDVHKALREGGRGGKSGVHSYRARAVLVVTEVALAAMALIAAGLAVLSFHRQGQIRPGFEPQGVLVAHLHLSTNGYSLEQEKQFNRNLRLRLEQSPGIEMVSYSDSAPLAILGPAVERVQPLGAEADEGAVLSISRSVVATGYLRLMHIPLLAGRDFTDRDDLSSEEVIIVNETLARKFFGDREPLGRKVRVSGKPATVIGLAKDAKYRAPSEGPTPFFYGAFAQNFFSGHTNLFFVRASNLDEARAALRREVAALDPNTGLLEVSTLAEYTEAGLFGERVAAGLLSALGVLALALAAVGLYSVLAYAVNERTQEIGIRMALGAHRWQVLCMVLLQGLGLTLAGLTLGVAGAMVWARVLSRTLGTPLDMLEPAVVAGVTVGLSAVALAASFVPARRATRAEPMMALRAE